MAKNTLTLFITADGKRALDTLKATDANIRKASDAALDLEQKLKRGEQVNYSLAEAFRFLNELVNRSVIAAKQLNPEVDLNEEAMKKWGIAIDNVARKGGAFGSEVLEYLKMQYASVNEQVEKSIKLEEESVRVLQEKIATQERLNDAQLQYNENLQNIIRTNVLGEGEYNVMGAAYGQAPETYEQTWRRLLQEQNQQLETEWIAAKKQHEQEKLQIEKAANEESYANYKDLLKKKKQVQEDEIKWIEAGIRYRKQIEGGAKSVEKTAKSVEKVSASTKTLATNTKSASSHWFKMFDTTKNVLQFRVIMNVINSIARLTDFISDSVQAAAEAEQIFSKLNTVFGDTSNAMSEAVSLASQIGVSTSTAASALSTVGDLLQTQGQTTIQSLSTASEWVSQFQDIIAFKDINMSLEEFAQNFMSGAAGNLRNFRTFGSIVRESAVNAELAKKGLDKLTGSELELAKMTTRAEMALEQQKNAIGATQREWDTMLSVQRRYEEQLKMFRENVGESLNPVVKMWIELKTVMLEVFNAQKTWQEKYKMVEEKKAIDTKYYTFDENGEIANQSNYLGLRNALDNANIMYGNGSEDSQSKAINSAILAMQEYGASITQITELFEEMQTSGMGVAGDFRGAFLEAAEEYIAELLKIEKENENIDKIIKEASFVDSMLEQIQQLGDISFAGSELYKTFTGELDKALNGEIDVNKLEETLGNVKKYLLDSVFKPIEETELKGAELVFSDDAELDRLNKIKDTYEALYSIIYSAGDEYSKYLELIETYWNDTNKEIETHNAQLEAQKKLISDIESVNSKTADYEKQLRQIDMSDTEKVLDNLNEMLEAATDENLKIAIEAQIAAFNNLTKATDERTRKEELEAKKNEIENSTATYIQAAADYRKQAEQLGMSEYEIAMQKYDEEFFRLQNAYNAASDELKDAIREQITAMFDERLAYIELTEAKQEYNKQLAWNDIESQFSGSFGELGTLFESLGSLGDITSGAGGLLSMLIDIIAKTEVVTRLGSLLSDSILPTLNAFLEPLLPVIDMISKQIQMIVQTILVPFFPILQTIASALVVTIGIFNTGMGMVTDGVKKTVGTVVKAIENMINWVIDLVNNIPMVDIDRVHIGASDWANIDIEKNMLSNIEEMNNNLKTVMGMSMEIADNTAETKDYDVYAKLLAAREISDEQYAKFTGMDKYTTKNLANGVTYAQGNKSYVNVNNLTVQVPEGMSLVDFLKGIEDYNNGHSLYGANAMVS